MTVLFLLLLSAQALAVPARQKAAAVGSKDREAATYRVRKGDSLYEIARRNDLSVKQLKQFNGLKSNAIKPGQTLLLGEHREGSRRDSAADPKAAATPAAKRSPSGKSAVRTHVVRKGDNLSRIARKYGLSVNELKRLNGLKGNALKPGQRLALSRPAPDPVPTAVISATPDAGELLRREAADPTTAEAELLDSAELAGESSPDLLEEVAVGYLSTPYRFGGSSRKGTDCSGFVQQVFRELNIRLPRSAREQYRVGTKVAHGDLQSGDLIFFRTYAKYPSHVGIYLGNGKMIHASPRNRRVVISAIDEPYFKRRYIGAKRIALLGATLNLQELTRGVEEAGEEVPSVDNPPQAAAMPAEQSAETASSAPAAN